MSSADGREMGIPVGNVVSISSANEAVDIDPANSASAAATAGGTPESLPSEFKAALSATAHVEKKNAKTRRRSERHELKTMVYLQLEHSTLPAITIDIGEHGLALKASEPVPMSSNVPFRCKLPGTDFTLHGHADVIWASEHGRAGLFFSRLAPASRKHLKQWLARRARGQQHSKEKDAVHELRPPADEHVSFAVSE